MQVVNPEHVLRAHESQAALFMPGPEVDDEDGIILIANLEF